MSPPQTLIIIPCHNEPDLLTTLNSLASCAPPNSKSTVVVVFNASPEHPPEVHQRNQAGLQVAQHWLHQQQPFFELKLIYNDHMPRKHAGVGLARRLGMDWAAEQLFAAGQPEGLIVNLDADCTVAPTYFQALEAHFASHPKTPGCSIYFEHPLKGPLDPRLYEGIVWYELFLRYYTHGLAYAQLPCAFQTVGSAMAVRARIYREEGGMNKRKAGEDFYFLHKIIERGGFTNLTTTTVYPSPRCSDRVPFGTGKALQDWLQQPSALRLNLSFAGFQALRQLSQASQLLYQATPAEIQAFEDRWVLPEWLAAENFAEKVQEIQANTTTAARFQQRFYIWLNGFKAMKCLHALRDQCFGEKPLEQEAALLWQATQNTAVNATPRALLEAFRQLDKNGET